MTRNLNSSKRPNKSTFAPTHEDEKEISQFDFVFSNGCDEYIFLLAVIKRMFGNNRNFNTKDFLTLGFNGSQAGISDYYTNNGSLYMASLAFLPLGLPADDPFWTDALQPWTSKKA